jgi:hypothetical protein
VSAAGRFSHFDVRWRLVVEFLKEYHREPAGERQWLLADMTGPVGDERWDVLFAGLAEHLAMRDGQGAPPWSALRGLRRFWFPFDTPGARAQALVHAPAAFRRRGVVADLLLAMKAFAARPRDAEDIRQLVQVLGLHTVDDVLAAVREIFPEEQPPERLRLLLEDIFPNEG